MDAKNRAGILVNRGHTDVFVSEIRIPHPQQSIIDIAFHDEHVRLPVLEDENGAVTFISTAATRQHLGVDYRISQLSEWLALDYIPRRLISNTITFN